MPTGRIELILRNLDSQQSQEVEIKDNSYKSGSRTKLLKPVGVAGSETTLFVDLAHSYNWYDFSVRVKDAASFEKRYAGRVETGKESLSDPLMGRV
jgi:phospholipase C